MGGAREAIGETYMDSFMEIGSKECSIFALGGYAPSLPLLWPFTQARGGVVFAVHLANHGHPSPLAHLEELTMKRLNLFVISLITLTGYLFTACNEQGGTIVEFSASGSPGEVLLVRGQDIKGTATEVALMEMLQYETPGLPQIEPFMRVQTVLNDNFSDFLRNMRNIVIVEIDPGIYTEPRIRYGYDQWAKGQLVITLTSPKSHDLKQFVSSRGALVRDLLLRHELYRYAEDWRKASSSKARELCKKHFAHTISVPADIVSSKEADGFLWMSNQGNKGRTDLVIYALAYGGEDDISEERMIARRDSLLAIQIPGGVPGSHMVTSLYERHHRYVTMEGGETRGELRGLWEMDKGDMMAGPFIMHAIARPDLGKTFYVEGFIYYPNHEKRELVRRIEAALYSFQSIEKEIFNPEQLRHLKWHKTLVH